ncbi:MFS transporter [Marivirga tractuosa]|uniref:Major facilitator superfamily MFS_1 n=1 Tax=Marivirga tractuosa (strain ATCC 23168 / DSM 4126 / NBRC 15989 / NCIMB 1408 / VKM B-1430 / H-43) TaxID=643867 RepID=E4TQW0_MARTH|nr:MFS transporter [Marivirga tractuosa]ADR21660.1 major facilitator superfamily MFS_1 [Marivirga tractuosa DSM 4126]BDD13883.1 MFS transporter [Marivirga tractuosa]
MKQSRLINGSFIALSFSAFLFFASFNMIIPMLPDYLTSLGGGEYKGLIIALFTITAGLSRPFSGKLADKIGRLPVMIFGAVVCFVAGLAYPFVSGVIAFFALRLLHGFSTGFTPTGNAAYVADIVPVNRRGEAMGIIGVAISIGTATGNAVGGYIGSAFPIDYVFYASAATALMSIIILAGMNETLADKVQFNFSLLKLKKNEIIEKRVLVPAIYMALSVFSFGIVLTIMPDYSAHLGISNKGLFFAVFVLASLGVRIIAGKISDKIGRVKVLKVSSFLLAVAMVLIALSNSLISLMGAAIVFGFSMGMNSPTVFAWAIDLADNNKRGKALATLYIFLELGIGMGAFISGWVYSNAPANFKVTFYTGAAFAFLAFVYLNIATRIKRMR